MSEADSGEITPQVQPEPVIPSNPETIPPAGMTKEAWEKMNLTWGLLEGLIEPPSARVIEAAAGDQSMAGILSMADGLLKAGERMGMSSDRVLSTLGEIRVSSTNPDRPQTTSEPTPPTIPTPGK